MKTENKTELRFNDDRDAVLSALDSADASMPTNAENETPTFTPPKPHGDIINNFISALTDNAASAIRVPNLEAIPVAVLSYLQQHNLPPTIICTPEWQTLDWQTAGISADCRAPKSEDQCGISGIVAAAADYGAMLVESTNPHQLTMSLLPPHHLAIVHARQIYPTLDEIMANSFDINKSPRARNLICGPSRTADIEQTLTLGAHGPVAVHVLIVE